MNNSTAINGWVATRIDMNEKLKWIRNGLLAITLLPLPATAQQMTGEDFRFSAETDTELRAEIDAVLRHLWGDPENPEPRSQYDCFLRVWTVLVTAYRNIHDVDVSTSRFTEEFIKDVNGLTLPEVAEFARETRKQYYELLWRYTAEDAAMLDSMSQRERDPEKREDMLRRRDALLERIEHEREQLREELKIFDCFEGIEDA